MRDLVSYLIEPKNPIQPLFVTPSKIIETNIVKYLTHNLLNHLDFLLGRPKFSKCGYHRFRSTAFRYT